MECKGIPVSRWIDGVLEDKKNIDQPNNIRAMVFWGHAANSQTRLPEMKKAMEKLDLMVVVDPVPTFASVIPDRKDGIYVLPVDHPVRDLRLGDRLEPLAAMARARCSTRGSRPSRPRDHVSVRQEVWLRQGDVQAHQGQGQRAADRGHHPRMQQRLWTIGYTGQSPERLKLHMANQHTFDVDHAARPRTARARATTTACRGRAGARPRSSIRARRSSTTPPSRWPKAV